MKKLFAFILFACLVLSFNSCRKNGPNPPGKGTTTGGPVVTQDCADLLVLSRNSTIKHYTDPYTLNSASVSGDYLKVSVTYGGSASHAFQLVWNDLSMAAMTNLSLEQNANGDMAKALITETRCFNITALRTNEPHGTVSFNVGSKTLSYTW